MKLQQHHLITPSRMWKMPRPRPFEPEGVTLGSWVTIEHRGREVTGQVWCKAGPHAWWVADGTEYLWCSDSECQRGLICQAVDTQERIAV